MYSQGEYQDTSGKNQKDFYDKLIYHEWDDQHDNGLAWWETIEGVW
jgi:hypothetical protein